MIVEASQSSLPYLDAPEEKIGERYCLTQHLVVRVIFASKFPHCRAVVFHLFWEAFEILADNYDHL